MTPSQAYALRMGEHVSPGFCVSVPSVCTTPSSSVNNLTPPEPSRPLSDASYNGVSLADRLFLQTSRFADPLHRSDQLALTHQRANGLIDYVKTEGIDKFKSNY